MLISTPRGRLPSGVEFVPLAFQTTSAPPVIACTSGQLDRILASLIQAGTELMILDTAGTMGPDIDAAIAASDIVLIPVAPSVCDLKACLPTARAARQMNKPFAFVLNSCSTGHQRINEAAALLSKLAVLAGEPVHRRTIYQDAYAKGLGVVELSDQKAIHEIDALWQWLKDKRSSMNEER